MSDGREDRLAIDAVAETLALKAVDRAGWVRRGVTRPESVAAHSWGIAWLVLLLLPCWRVRARCPVVRWFSFVFPVVCPVVRWFSFVFPLLFRLSGCPVVFL